MRNNAKFKVKYAILIIKTINAWLFLLRFIALLKDKFMIKNIILVNNVLPINFLMENQNVSLVIT